MQLLRNQILSCQHVFYYSLSNSKIDKHDTCKKIYSPDLIVAFICQIEEALSDILSLLTGGIKCETELTFSSVTLVTKATLIKEIYEQRTTFYLGFFNPSLCLTVWNTLVCSNKV
jgi:hypothetical protein